MTLEETLKQLKALGNEKMRAQNTKNGAGDNQFGVRLGDIRKLAKKIKTKHELALALWETGNIDAAVASLHDCIERLIESETYWGTARRPRSVRK